LFKSSKTPVKNFASASLSAGAVNPLFRTNPFLILLFTVLNKAHASLSLSKFTAKSNSIFWIKVAVSKLYFNTKSISFGITSGV